MPQILSDYKAILNKLWLYQPSLCWDLERWIKDNPDGGKILKFLGDSYIPQYDLPQDLAGNSLSFPEKQKQVGVYKRYVSILENITLHSAEGFIQLSDGSFVVETAWISSNLINHPSYYQRFKPSPKYMKGKWFSCLMFWSYGYYHWLCDVLPRFYKVLEYLPENTKFIVPAKMENWKLNSLEAIGINADRCVKFDGKKPWKLEKLYYAPPVAMTGDHEPEAMLWVAKCLRDRVENNKNTNSLKLFVSRAKAKCRSIINEKEIYLFLKSKGFQKICAEDYSLEEQIALFRRASIIVAPHGAGLTNMLFCEPYTKIVEIFEPETLRRCYWSLAKTLGHQYKCFIGRRIPNNHLDTEANIFVDLEDFSLLFSE